jgi:hypothetical protein
MSQRYTWSIAFSTEELYYLACILPAAGLIGFEYPFPGPLEESSLELAKQSLVERGYIKIHSDGEVVLDVIVAGLVIAAAYSACTLVTSRVVASGSSHCRLVHLAPNLILEQEVLDDEKVTLTAVSDAETLEDRLRDFFNLPDVPPAPGFVFTLTEPEMAQTRRLASEGAEVCSAYLARFGIPLEVARVLALTLSDSPNIGSLSTMRHKATGETYYENAVAWIADSLGAWRIESLPPLEEGQPSEVRLIPTSSAEIQQRLADILHKALSDFAKEA